MMKEQIAAIAVVLLLGAVFLSVVRRLWLNQIKFGYKNNPVKCG